MTRVALGGGTDPAAAGDTRRGNITEDIAGRWCVAVLRLPATATEYVARLRLDAAADDALGYDLVVRRTRFSPPLWIRIICLSRRYRFVELRLWGRHGQSSGATVDMFAVPRLTAAILLVARHPILFLRSLKSSSAGASGRVRKAVQILALRPAPPLAYRLWREMYDEDEALAPKFDGTDEGTKLVGCLFGPSDAPAGASRAALLAQSCPPIDVIDASPEGWRETRARLENSDAVYVAVLQAGEVIPKHALAVVRQFLAAQSLPDLVYADEDVIDATGDRSSPLFKPPPNLTLMHSATLARGLWVIRRTLLLQCSDEALRWAETVRLESWFRGYESGRAEQTHRIPLLLASRLPDTQAAPPESTAATVSAHLVRAGLSASVSPGYPVLVSRRSVAQHLRKASIVIPSACLSEKTMECVGSVLAMTRYDDFEVIVVTAQNDPLSAVQLANVERLAARGKLRHTWLQSARFNYSEANNHGVALAGGDHICLLNDDVMPLGGDWLSAMVAFFEEARVGVVGAKLYYPNMLVQHGGVIAGLAGLAEHVNRFLPRGEPGYAWRGILNQELSAVTGACLLTRRDLYDDLGGLDVGYPIGFNDVDYCFRVREAGRAVVFAAEVEMIHFENFTFGAHYGGDRSSQEMLDVERMLLRWRDLVANDPFHNPNLSLQRGNEWGLACPPRRPY